MIGTDLTLIDTNLHYKRLDIPLPSEVEEEKITAKYDKKLGELTVLLQVLPTPNVPQEESNKIKADKIMNNNNENNINRTELNVDNTKHWKWPLYYCEQDNRSAYIRICPTTKENIIPSSITVVFQHNYVSNEN